MFSDFFLAYDVNVPLQQEISRKHRTKNSFVIDENSRIRIQDPDPDPLDRGMDPRIRIHNKM